MNRCPICNKQVDPKEAEKHAKAHVAMGEVGPKTTTRLLAMVITLGEPKEKEGK